MSSHRIAVCGGAIDVETINDQSGSISSYNIKDLCPHCKSDQCAFDCRGSRQYQNFNDIIRRLRYNAAIDGIEGLVLALACAGCDVSNKPFVDAITTAIESAYQNIMED